MTMEDSGACDSRVLRKEPDGFGSDGQGAWREVKSRSMSVFQCLSDLIAIKLFSGNTPPRGISVQDTFCWRGAT